MVELRGADPIPISVFFRLGLWVAVMQTSGSGSGFVFPPVPLLCGHFCSQLVKQDVIINRKKLKEEEGL